MEYFVYAYLGAYAVRIGIFLYTIYPEPKVELGMPTVRLLFFTPIFGRILGWW